MLLLMLTNTNTNITQTQMFSREKGLLFYHLLCTNHQETQNDALIMTLKDITNLMQKSDIKTNNASVFLS